MAATMHLEILTPEKRFFSGEVESLVVDTADGSMGVMPGHTPLVAALTVGAMRLKHEGVWLDAFISDGFMQVYPKHVLILLEMVEWPEDIDAYRAEQERIEAEEAMRQSRSMIEYQQSKIALTRALVRLRVRSTKDVDQL